MLGADDDDFVVDSGVVDLRVVVLVLVDFVRLCDDSVDWPDASGVALFDAAWSASFAAEVIWRLLLELAVFGADDGDVCSAVDVFGFGVVVFVAVLCDCQGNELFGCALSGHSWSVCAFTDTYNRLSFKSIYSGN